MRRLFFRFEYSYTYTFVILHTSDLFLIKKYRGVFVRAAGLEAGRVRVEGRPIRAPADDLCDPVN